MKKYTIQSWLACLFMLVMSISQTKAQSADFTVNDSSGCGTLTAIFQDLSTPQATAIAWDWDFGDNSIHSVLQNPIHIYPTVGCYDVTLTVTYTNGSTQSITKPDFVCVHGYPNIAVSNANLVGCSPLLVNICDLTVSNGDSITSWIWDIPNQPLQTDSCLNLTISDVGVYDVTYVVTNNFGCTSDSTFNDMITVNATPEIMFTTATPSSTCLQPPLILDFQNQTTLNGISNSPNVTYQWQFPGASSPAPPTSTLSNPTAVTYSAAGNYDVTLIATSNQGCKDTLTQIDFVAIGPIVADFNIPATVCAGKPTTFTNNSSGGANTFSWDRLCDGSINGTGANHTVTYPTPGTYCLLLIAKNPAEGCADTVSKTITVNPSPVADFTVDHALDCGIPSTFVFSNTTNLNTTPPTGATFSWDFGSNGTPSTAVTSNLAATISVTYNTGGANDVTMIAENSFGCTNTKTITDAVTIAPPVANINAIKREGCIPFTTNFTSTATPSGAPYTPYTYEWIVSPSNGVTFSPSNLVAAPSITFADTGKFDITLVITTPGGCKDTVTKNDYIKTGELPIFDFTIDDTNVCVKQEIQFTCIPTQPGWKYSWDFKYDGTFNTQSTLSDPVYAYTDTGHFSPSLIVNNNGCKDTLIKIDSIYVNPPKADFTYTPAVSCSVPFQVSFTNTSVVPAAPTMNYLWTFNMGGPTNVFSTAFTPPNQTYPPAGTTTYPATFSVKLRVTDPVSGCADSLLRNVTIGQPLSSFTITDNTVCKGIDADFTSTAQNLGVGGSYSWYFGDNSSGATTANASHAYSNVGNYTVCLVATDNTGICKDSTCLPITITGPDANFSSSDTIGCAPMAVNFTDLTTPYPGTTITTYAWLFGSPPNTSALQNPSHTYNTIGNFQVKLTVTDSDGCKDDKVINYATSNPTVTFTVNDTILCNSEQGIFDPNLTGAAYPATFVWNWGQGPTQSIIANAANNVVNVPHAYTSATGSPFTVSVTVTDANGCVSTLTKPDYIDVSTVTADFTVDNNYAPCPTPPLISQFTNTSTTSPNPGTTITNSSWNFGDGTGSSLPNPGHVYTYADSFDVTLIVTNSVGCKDTTTKPHFIIIDGPYGTYTIQPSKVCPGDTAVMTIYTQNTDVIQIDPQTANLNVILVPVTNTTGADTTIVKLPYTIPGIYTPLVKILKGNCEYVIPANGKKVEVYSRPNAVIDPAAPQGCKPFSPNFTSQTIPATGTTIASYSWFAPVGNPASASGATQTTFSTTFTASGVDTVFLMVVDSHGCKDTAQSYVTTFETPTVNFTVAPDSQGCAPFTAHFFDQTTGTVPTTWSWNFGAIPGVNSTVKDPTNFYANDGVYTVTLTVSDANGCTGTLTKNNYMQLQHPVANFTVSDSVGCAPFPVVFDGSLSSSPYGISLYTWQPVAGTVIIPFNAPTDTLPYTYASAGSYDVALIVTDAKGCKDTLIKNNYIQVSTATNPDTLLLRRATVQGMRKVRVDYETYPFSDFKQYYLMRYNTPFQVWVKVDSSYSQTTSTLFDSLPDLNTENFSYQYAVLVKNQCDRLSSLARSDKHHTVNTSVQSLTDAIKVRWSQYKGWTNVLQYDIYRSTGYSYNQNSFAFLASVPGNVLEYVDNDLFCSDSAYYRILAIEQAGNLQQSWSDVAGTIPIHNAPITTVELVAVTVDNDSVNVITWKPYLGYKPKNYLIEKSYDGIVWYELATPSLTQNALVDADVVVDEMYYYYRVFAQDSCGDKSRLGNIGRTILLTATLHDDDDGVVLKWSPYLKWEKGVKYYDIEIFDEAFGWKLVTTVAGDVTTFTDYKTQIKQGTYCYRIIAHEDKEEEATSTSNVDCVTFKPRMYLPNAFTPNGDGNNDVFSIGSLNVKSASYTIFDRWGRIVFEGGSINDVWDGTDKGKSLPEGVYMYKIKAIGVNDQELIYNGSITLIR